MTRKARLFALAVGGAFLLAGAGYCLYVSATTTGLLPRETGLLSFILFLLSVLATWLLSHVYASLTNRELIEEKLNTIAVQSSEKILNLSVQIWRVEQFLATALEDVEAEIGGDEGAAKTLKDRVVGAGCLLRSLRSTNNTFLSDWKGIVSPGVKQEIESQVRAQADIINAYEEIDQARAEKLVAADDETKHRIDQVLRRIEEQKAQLPVAVAPDRFTSPFPAVATTQHPDTSTPEKADGYLELTVLRPVFTVTGSGKFIPNMGSKPVVYAELESSPPGSPGIQVRAGTGTNFDFNVHL